MFDKLGGIWGGFVSKRLIVFVVNKLSIIATPFLAQYGLHLKIDENMLISCLVALVANAGAYIWAETHRPSKASTTETTTTSSTPKSETTTVKTSNK